MILKIDHVGIAVRDVAERLAFWRDALGMEVSGLEEVATEKVRVAFLAAGPSRLELLEPTSPDSPIARFLDKRGATMLRSEFTPGFKCAHMAKDLRIAEAMATALGVTHPLLAQARADYARLEAEGRGDADTSALILLKRTARRE